MKIESKIDGKYINRIIKALYTGNEKVRFESIKILGKLIKVDDFFEGIDKSQFINDLKLIIRAEDNPEIKLELIQLLRNSGLKEAPIILQIALFDKEQIIWEAAVDALRGLETQNKELSFREEDTGQITPEDRKFLIPKEPGKFIPELAHGRGKLKLLKPEEIKNRKKESKGQAEKRCGVCTLIIKKGDFVIPCPHCNHPFHEDHIFEWVKIKGSCPVCRQQIHVSKN